ncbi:MAG: cyclic nucleotide-binding domain-containing protein [Terriglobales bacterium]
MTLLDGSIPSFLATAWHPSALWAGDYGRLIVGVVLFFVLAGILRITVPSETGSVRLAVRLFLLSVLLLFAAAFVPSATVGRVAYWGGLFAGSIAVLNLASVFIFDLFLTRFTHTQTPRILRDLVVGVGYFLVALTLLSHGGVSLSNLVTTSAIASAVIAFSLQDTLGNVMAGLALQLEKTIDVGDWVKVDQTTGRVTEIRWRYTAIETRNWDTVVIPNSQLMKAQVQVLGRRQGAPMQHRQWVYFNVDFRVPPTEVIRAVTEALTAEPLENVAATPFPNCVLMDFKESYCQYAVRYWLTDLAVDDPTDSRMRCIIYFALKRAGIPLSIPALKQFMVAETDAHEQVSHQKELQRRMAALSSVDLFRSLTNEERRTLAERLHFAPFTKGEVITRQGADAHWLYILTRGSAEVVIMEDGFQRDVAKLDAGQFFGEMSLMTGAPRSASVISLEDTTCYRLDKDAFCDIVRQRPEIAEHASRVMAERLVGLEAARGNLSDEVRERRMRAAQKDIVTRIRVFFGLDTQ